MSTNDYMIEALSEARLAFQAGEVPVGAVIVRDGAIIARGHNTTETVGDPTCHAEMNAIRQAAEALGGWRLTGCSMYVTCEPCTMCAAAISMARIKTLYFGAYDPKGGAVVNGVRFYDSPTCHHRPEVCGGILEAECGEILKRFFRNKRRKV